MHDLALSRLLGLLYSAPTAPELWEAFLRGLCDRCHTSNAALISHDIRKNEHNVISSCGESLAESADSYTETYWRFDEWTSRGLAKLQSDNGLVGFEIWRDEDLLRSIFYNEFLKCLDIRSVACVSSGNPSQFDVLSIYRGYSDYEQSTEDMELLRMLLPHFEIAMSTRRKLMSIESRLADLESAFHLLGTAVILLDAEARAVLVNDKARAILNRREGLRLRNSKLTTDNLNDASKLRLLFDRAAANRSRSGVGGAVPIQRDGKKPLQVLVCPLHPEQTRIQGRAALAVFISDPDAEPAVPADLLKALFGLTPAEARLAISILRGNSISSAADIHGVSRETTKSQMTSIFLKTGTSRQGDLVRLLARLPLCD